MKDKLVAAVVTAIVHNRKMSIAGLVGLLAVLAAKFGLQFSQDTLVWLAVVIIGALGAFGGDSHRQPAAQGLLGLGDTGRDIAVAVGVQAFLSALKSPGARAKFRAVSLQVFRQLKIVFAGDPDFS